MRAGRLLTILLMLSVRGRVSAADLAAELEVSLRTVYRDVEALSAAGVPVYATRGRAGGFALLDGYRTRLTGMTRDEADALFLAGVPGAAADLGLGAVLVATQLKLLAALPAPLRERAEHIRDRFHLDAPGWLRDVDTPPLLAVISEAVWTAHRLDLRYERADRSIADRTVDPLGLVLKAGTWYLVASRVDDDRGPRAYRVSRVQVAAVRAETFRTPPGFALEEFWTQYQRGYAERVFTKTALVRLSAEGRELLFLLGSVPAREARAQLGEPDGSGWATTRIPIESVRHARHALMQLGEHVEVMEPADLRAAIEESARTIAQRYATSPFATPRSP